MAKRRARGRELNGVLLLDKPLGMSSNKILQAVKNIYFAQKAGHTGSLDPLATGMLPICFGEATKFSQFLLDSDKHYQVTAQLGVRTNTGDKEGEIIATKDSHHVQKITIDLVLEKFLGEIAQIPPMFSALKHQGQPLYQLARQGIEVERKPRKININTLSLLNFNDKDKTFCLEVKCSKGTYVRTLIEDIAQALNCVAHVTILRRLSVSHFTEAQMVSFARLETMRQQKAFSELDNLLLPLEYITQTLPKIELTAVAELCLRQGQAIDKVNSELKGLVRLYSPNKHFIGVGEIIDNGHLLARRLIKI